MVDAQGDICPKDMTVDKLWCLEDCLFINDYKSWGSASKDEDADEPIWLGDTETSKFLGGSSTSDELKKRKLPLCCKQPQSMIIT